MITGAHSIIYSKHPEADRAFLRDVLGLPNVDVGGTAVGKRTPRASSRSHSSPHEISSSIAADSLTADYSLGKTSSP